MLNKKNMLEIFVGDLVSIKNKNGDTMSVVITSIGTVYISAGRALNDELVFYKTTQVCLRNIWTITDILPRKVIGKLRGIHVTQSLAANNASK